MEFHFSQLNIYYFISSYMEVIIKIQLQVLS